MGLKKKFFYLIPSLMIMTTLALSACQDGNGTKKVRVVPANKTGQSLDPVLDSKLTPEQQRYVKDPLELPGYDKTLSFLFSKTATEAKTLWPSLFKLKRWIIGPVTDKNEKKDFVAISKSAADGEYAHQTMSDIFIDAAIFDGKNEGEQGQIILNEFLTSLYSMKFLTDSQLCKLVEIRFKGTKNCESKKIEAVENPEVDAIGISSDSLQGAVQSSTPHLIRPGAMANVLERDDYLNIERMTRYILDQGEKLTHATLVSKLKESGFDVRIFSFKLSPEGMEDAATISDTDIDSLITQLKAQGQTAQICFSIQLGSQTSCKSSINKIEGDATKLAVTRGRVEIELKDAEGEKILSETVFQMKKIKMAKHLDEKTKEEIYVIPLTGVGLKDPKEGVAYRMNYLLANKVAIEGKTQFKLLGLFSIPGVVTKVQKNGDKKPVECEGHLAEAKNQENDLVLMAESDKYLETIKAMTVSVQHLPPCW